jgi:hypothetical protein
MAIQEKIINNIKKTEWVPYPLVEGKEFISINEKQNLYIAENTVIISLSNLTYKKRQIFVEVYYDTLSKPKKGNIYSVHDSDFRGELEWTLESNEFQYFYPKELNFKIYKKN